ncbi:hypothetical protein [Merismopedia glauca]|uniref:Uncharacterized protein n=1 Tax=Merismopedia glauca CCAP 1448/3 TaxID=1296344 RepID=A0A2T1C1C5_9CYAN|nr:hypothetical protein [Merismopedia glauca]PSB02076.1 hypothetical protein C7B64_15100 [Merismopedia glauca CCAP 1448/3]
MFPNNLLEIGQHQEAQKLLAQEVPRFKQIAQTWGSELISDRNSSLSTAYRFSAPIFNNYITPERVARIKEISPNDSNLNNDSIRWKKNEAAVALEMSNAKQRYNQTWVHQQIAVAEYLDALSELAARLDTLQDFAALCEAKEVKSSKELLPDETAKPGLYLLPA